MNLFDAIFKNDRESPAVIYQGRTISYRDLRRRTIDMAKVIASLGTNADDRIVLLLNDSPEFIEAFIAICSMGAIAVPINPALKVEDQNAIIHNCRARFAIVEPEFFTSVLTRAADGKQFLEQVITVDRLQDLLHETQPNEQPAFADDEDKTAFILYTSGSTGEPKGAMHSQAHVFYTNKAFCREVLKLTPSDRLFSSSRLPFAYGLGNSFSFPLLNGATSVLCREKPTAEIISRTLSEARPTIFFAVPVVYNLLLEYHRTNQLLDCSSLRMCVSAGEALPARLGEQWEKTFCVPVLDGIGSTEMLHMFMSNQLDDVCYGSSGKLLSAYEAKLLDEHDQPSAEGVEGNLWIKGMSTFSVAPTLGKSSHTLAPARPFGARPTM